MKIKSILPFTIVGKSSESEDFATYVMSYLCKSDTDEYFLLTNVTKVQNILEQQIIESASIYINNFDSVQRIIISDALHDLPMYSTSFNTFIDDNDKLNTNAYKQEDDKLVKIDIEVSPEKLYSALFFNSYYFSGLHAESIYDDDDNEGESANYIVACLMGSDYGDAIADIPFEIVHNLDIVVMASPNSDFSKFDRFLAKISPDILSEELIVVCRINNKDEDIILKIDSNDGKVYDDEKFKDITFDNIMNTYDNDSSVYFTYDIVDITLKGLKRSVLVLAKNNEGKFKVLLMEADLLDKTLAEKIEKY